ncbi:hypothetical protein PDE_04701 [Penicillium oxalicum 114-2]|uniref:Uncharacterized protein n=1 Tax=Penicillium oxalicum (strain 114-2 / CGMCC 5302) TaxID=933388 RepID=S7ZM25_PENO1|nr:hypothetical protein PDE_04701 [Penicillium oxalicum 114-2]
MAVQSVQTFLLLMRQGGCHMGFQASQAAGGGEPTYDVYLICPRTH